MKTTETTPQRILLINVSRIGDTLLTSPTIRALAQCYPGARIDFLGHPKRFEVVKHLPWLTSVGAISKKRAPFMGWAAALTAAQPYDLAFVWGQDEELVRYALRVSRQVIAWEQMDSRLNQRLKAAVPIPSDKDIPLSRWQMALLTPVLQQALDDIPLAVAYRVLQEELAWAETVIKDKGVQGKILIGLIIESFPTMPHRDWPIEHFVSVTGQLAERHPESVFLLFGAAIPEYKIQALQAALQGRLIVLSDTLSIRQSAALMSLLDLYIGLDTGPSHIIAALGVPAVVLFHCMRRGPLVLSPSEPERLTMIEHPEQAAFCSFDTSMAAISPAHVLAEAERRLEAERK